MTDDLVEFTFTDTPDGDLGFPCDAPEGTQAAFIGDTGTMSQTVNFTKTGEFALGFYAAVKSGAGNQVEFYLDGVKYYGPWTPGAFERRSDDLAIWWGTAVVPVTTIGNHTLTIKGTGKAGEYMFFDGMKILSTASIYGPNCSHFPAMGEANGQDPNGGLNAYVNTLHGEVNWGAAWGLKTMAYEGGWSVGGDFDQKPIHDYCKYHSPLTIDADTKAIDVYTRGGGSLFCYYYDQWPGNDVDHASQYPLVQAVIKRNDRLAAEVNYGTLVPANLTALNISLTSSSNADTAGNIRAQGAWICWNIIAPMTQTYQVSATVAGAGGAYVLLLDDATTVATGNTAADVSGTVQLMKGQHTIKLRSTGATAFSVKNIAVTMLGGPAAPTQFTAHFANGRLALSWAASPAATGFVVSYGSTAGNYTTALPLGRVTSTTLTDLDAGAVYYVAVQACDANNLLSLCSNELRVAQRSTDPQVLLDFEDQPVDGKTFPALTLKNYQFTAFGNLALLQVQGKAQGWPSNLLFECSWGEDDRIQRADLQPFDLYSLDLNSNNPGFSAIITGYDPSGASFRRIVNFPTGQPNTNFVLPVVLDWVRVVKVEIVWCNMPDGGNTQGRFGGIDNLLFNKSVGQN